MFFEEYQKKIYQYPGREQKYDPLEVDHLLTIYSENRLNEYIAYRNAPHDDLGDVSPQGKLTAKINAANAEIQLTDIARKAFGLPPFPEMMTAEVLEILYDFLEWMEKKGERGEPQQVSSELSPGVLMYPPPTKSIYQRT